MEKLRFDNATFDSKIIGKTISVTPMRQMKKPT